MPFLPPWITENNPLDFMRAGAGLGLQLRSQAAQEQQQAAANALQQQSLFQQAQARQQQVGEAQARMALEAADQQTRRDNTMAQLAVQQGFHADTLAEQARDNARADAARALADKRQAFTEDRDAKIQERLARNDETALGFKKREADLAEEKFKAGSAGERKTKAATEAAIAEYRDVFGEPDEAALTSINNAVISGQFKQPTPKDSEKIQVNTQIAQAAARVANAIENFDSEYGKGAFTKGYSGKINSWINDLERGIVAAPPNEKDRKAWAIAQEFQGSYNPLALIRSGTAITPTERVNLDREIGSIRSGNFASEVKKYGETRTRELVGVVNSLKGRRSLSRATAEAAEQLRQNYGLTDVPEVIAGYQSPVRSTAPRPTGGGEWSPEKEKRLMELRARTR